jgi:GNAT superfamily N-acetyltransferase
LRAVGGGYWLARMLEIREVDPHDERALTDWYATMRDGASAGRAAPLVHPYSSFVRSVRSPSPTRRRIPVAALEDGGTVGTLTFELPLAENLTVCEAEVNVPPGRRGQGIGSALAEWALRRAADEGRTVVEVEVHVPAGQPLTSQPGARFATRFGAAGMSVEDHLVLALPADVAQSPLPAGYQLLSWAGICPEEHLADLAGMHTAMSEDVPTGEATHETAVWDIDRVRTGQERTAKVWLSLMCLIRTVDGEPAGYTQILLSHDDPANALQEDTFVARAHRGKRLSAVLKAANLKQLTEHGPGRRWLHTWTSEENPAMQKVNAEFGFVAVEQTHIFERRP